MNKNLTFKLLGLLLLPMFCYAQVNPRMVNAKYAKTIFYDDFSSSQTFITNWEKTIFNKGIYSFVDTTATVYVDENNNILKLSMLKIPGGYA